jgi:hypothetical protein
MAAAFGVVEAFRTGSISVAEFKSRLESIGATTPAIGAVTTALVEQAGALDRAQRATQLYKQELAVAGEKKPQFFRGPENQSMADLDKATSEGTAATVMGIREAIAVQQLRVDGLETEADVLKKIQELRKQSPPILVDRDALTYAFQELQAVKNVAEAKKALMALEAEEASQAEQAAYKSLTADNDVLDGYQKEANAIRLRADSRDYEVAAIEKFIQARNAGSSLPFDFFLNREREISTLKQVSAAYDELRNAANAASLEEERAAGEAAKSFGDFYSGIRDKIRNTTLRAQGKDTDARAQEIYMEALKSSVPISYEVAKGLASQEAAADKLLKTHERAKREAENFTEKLKRLKEEAQGAFLGDIDRSVVEHARSMKATAQDIATYVEAAKTGNFSGVPKQIMDLRQIELIKGAGAEYRNIIQQYGTWAQITPLAQEAQEKLNVAVQSGAITAGQAKVAYGDFLAGFGSFKWINQASDAIGQFAEDAILDFQNINTAAQNLAKSLAKVAIQMAITDPLKQGFKGLIGDWFGFGGAKSGNYSGSASNGTLFNSPDFSLHTGGVVGSAGRSGSHGSFAGAPRFHSGLTSREFKAVLEQGEHVLTAHQGDRTASTISGLTQMVGSRGGVTFSPNVQIVLPTGATKTDADQAQMVGVQMKKQLRDLYREFTLDEMAPGGLHNQ